MFAIQKNLADICSSVLEEHFRVRNDVVLEIPRESGKGDFTTSIALPLGKRLKMSPHDIASRLADALRTQDGVMRVDVLGPGYVNIYLTSEALIACLTESSAFLSPLPPKKGIAPVIIEFSSPNIAKPLGIHHVLSTIIGQALVNVYRHLGYATISINHIGDWGTQYGKLAVAYEKWGTKPITEYTIDEQLALYVRFHDEAEKMPSLEDEARAAFKKLEQGDAAMREFWRNVVDMTMQDMNRQYSVLGVSFDFVQGESFYEDKMSSILEEGKENGVFREGREGALIAEFSEESKLSPAIVLKGDGSTIYLTRDLATARYRIDRWHPSEILYVVDVAQQLFFKQLFAVIGQLGWETPAMEHVFFGRMSFADRKMSTRKGTILKLDDVIQEGIARSLQIIEEKESELSTEEKVSLAEMMGIGSIVYGVLSQNRKMDMIFDWDKFLSFEGNSAPYVQYTHARARSVLRKAGYDSCEFPRELPPITASERDVIRLLLQWPAVLESMRAERMPHRLAQYIFELCQTFNTFYNAESILQAEGSSRDFRLALTSLMASFLNTGASILTLRVPDRM